MKVLNFKLKIKVFSNFFQRFQTKNKRIFSFLSSIFVLVFSFFLLSCSSQAYKRNLNYSYEIESEPSRGNDEIDVMLGPVPVEENKEVSKWINYFQNRGYKHMVLYLERSTRYMGLMKKILKEEGMPEDLVYIALIESGFSSKAYSRASAVGYWQFLRGTGKRYGLKINAYVDERRDFIEATRAAANYFKSLYNLFGNWYLVMASYNAGENRIKNLVMKYQTRDFWYLARNKKLPRETINYVPKFLAATLIAKHPEKYGFINLNYQEPVSFDLVPLTHSIDLKKLAQHMKVSYTALRRLNPAFLSRYVPVYRTGATLIKVPKDRKLMATVALQKSKASFRYTKDFAYYRVKRGDTLSQIATRYRASVSQLQRMNGLSSRSFIRIGQRLKVPEASAYRSPKLSQRGKKISSQNKKLVQKGRYRVERGDTLWGIAKSLNISYQRLANYNKLSSKARLRVGQVLKIPNQNPNRSLSKTKAFSSKKYKYHSVKKGESLYKIAKKYNTTVKRLKELNSLSRSHLAVGQSLIVSSYP